MPRSAPLKDFPIVPPHMEVDLQDLFEAKHDGALLAHRLVCVCIVFLTSGQRSADKQRDVSLWLNKQGEDKTAKQVPTQFQTRLLGLDRHDR